MKFTSPMAPPLSSTVWSRVDMLEHFPTLFTSWCVFVFLMPLVKSYSFLYDNTVRPWIGTMPRYTLILPLVLVFAGYCVHRVSRAPSKSAVIISLIGSSLVFVLLGNHAVKTAFVYGNLFAASDCRNFAEKYELEHAWLAARDFHASCMDGSNQTAVHAISDCPGYASTLRANPKWRYLHEVETEYSCGGWCEPHSSLWSVRRARDSCSTVVSEVLESKVQYFSSQVETYNMIIVLTSAVLLILLGPTFREHGLSW